VNDLKNPWSKAIQAKGFVVQLIFTAVSILMVVSLLPYFFHSIIGPKPGIRINDVVLNALTPQDHSWIIFGLIYLSLMITLQGIYRKPELVLLGLKSYLALTLFRMVTMYVITLEAPEGIIPLHDPLVDVIAYGGNVFNKDLFFSGHVATLTLFVLVEERPIYKRILLVNSLLVAGLILLQRVHYTVDVVVSPFMSIAIFRMMKWVSHKERMR
jgi:PAP2 superfamily C-terminal